MKIGCEEFSFVQMVNYDTYYHFLIFTESLKLLMSFVSYLNREMFENKKGRQLSYLVTKPVLSLIFFQELFGLLNLLFVLLNRFD